MERRFKHRLLSLVLALVMTLTLLPMSAMATETSTSSELDYRIVHLDCGRKYFSVDNIKSIIDTASEAGFNYLELAFGNDGLRFLLDDMSVTIEQTATADYSVDEQSTEEDPAEPETPVEEPAAEPETPAEEPAAEPETPAEEPAAEDETSTEEPTAEDETSTEEPAAEDETSAGEPAAEEETSTEEPAAETEAETEEPAVMPTSMTTTAAPASTTTKEYSSADVTAAIQDANKAYYNAGDKNELTQEEMDTIIAYAKEKGMSIIPLFNTPGHMNAVVSAMATLGIDGDYNGSANTIDITNETAVAFTKALVQKYITYFAGKGCTVFNIGADEYANDVYSTGGMGFAQLVSAGQYDEFVTYVNELIDLVQAAGMKPMAFNDGIYYNSNTTTKIDTNLLVAYWTCGWGSYNVASASFLDQQGFTLVNTNGDYYWVLGKTNAQCSADKASGFDVNTFIGNSTISDPAGAMFCIWCDVPGADTADNVVKNTADTITAFGGAIYTAPVADDVTKKHPATGITVTAPGLTDLTASSKSVAVTIEGAEAVAAYDVTPKTESGDYTGSATITFPIPSTWNLEGKTVKGYVVNSDGTYELIDGTLSADNATFTFICPHFSETGIVLLDASNDVATENRTITITEGGTATDTISGANYAGTYNTADPSIATVTVTGSDAQESTVSYTEAAVTCNDLISSNSTTWLPTGYYYQVDSNYYPLYAKRVSAWLRNTYTWGYSTDGTNFATIREQSASSTTTPTITVYEQSTTPGTPASTTVTFNGLAVGSTTVTIGNVLYTVNVVEEDLTNAGTLTIEYWITNAHVIDGNGNQTLSVSASQAYGEAGVAISDLVPQNALKAGDNYPTVYWKARRLPDAYRQILAGNNGVDRCTDENGTDITHIRYYGGQWAYSSDGTTWTAVESNDQIVAYYMQVSTVTDEVTTVFVDYGVEQAQWNQVSYLRGNYVYLDFAVRYPSSERVPDSFITDRTLLYHCNPGTTDPNTNVRYRTLKPILGIETAEYEIYMITVTPTSDGSGSDLNNTVGATKSYTYDGTEKVAWAATEEDFANSGMEKWTSISGTYSYTVGGDPLLSGLEIYNLQGMRVTYYLRAKVTEDSLTVHYIDRTAGGNEFYKYNIAVNSGTVFDEGIALPDPWKGNLTNGTVTNSNNRTQTVSSDLSTLTELSNAYKDRDYICVEVTRSTDGKDVYLYYEFNDTHTVVYDYGLSITVPASELGLENAATVTATSSTTHCGTVEVNDDKSVTYTPNTMSPRLDDVTLIATFTDTGTEYTTTTVLRAIPATTVYYEDNFLTFSSGWTGSDTQSGTQAYNTIPYGYDEAYATSGNYSNGSAHTVTIPQGGASQTATFTFTGTGFDIYGTSAPASGLMKVQVSNASGVVKTVNVQNTGNTLLYQVPVVSIEGLTHGTYDVTVTCYAAYDSQYDALSRGGEHVIDAVVIYNPLATEDPQYSTDKEANAVRLEVRNAIIEAQDYNVEGGAGVLYLNATGDGSVEDYTLVGPNNEAYLDSNHAIAFTLATSAPVETLQIGAKSADGQSVTMSVTVNDVTTEKTISTATAMNYVLGLPTESTTSYNVVITNTGSGVLSITDVKATFASDATAAFTYSAANVDTPSEPKDTDAQIVENGVTITTSRVRYGRDMTIEVVTDKALVDGQSFSVKAGSRTYTVNGGSRYGLTVSGGVDNGDGTYTYTLTLKPYAYSLLKSTTFTVTLSGTTEGSASTGSDSAKVYLF